MHIAYISNAYKGMLNLNEEESMHCVKVLRMKVGDNFCVTNGQGLLFDAVLCEAHSKHAVVELTNPRRGGDKWNFNLQIGVAPTKNNDRIEWFLEKATEIGVDKVSFFESFHSERRAINMSRLEKVTIAAIKQSLKSRLPEIDDVVSFEKLIKQPFDGQKFIAWIDESVQKTLAESYKKGSNCFVLIGPEGDFSKEEVQLAINEGFIPVSLGKARLRTETAAFVACHTVHIINSL